MVVLSSVYMKTNMFNIIFLNYKCYVALARGQRLQTEELQVSDDLTLYSVIQFIFNGIYNFCLNGIEFRTNKSYLKTPLDLNTCVYRM